LALSEPAVIITEEYVILPQNDGINSEFKKMCIKGSSWEKGPDSYREGDEVKREQKKWPRISGATEILKYELTYYKLSVKRLNSVTVSSLFTD
jgi:hypothetical protein